MVRAPPREVRGATDRMAMKKVSTKSWIAALLMVGGTVLAPARAHTTEGETRVEWYGNPCTEPVLMIPTDPENVARHVPASFPGSTEEFMSHVVTAPGPDGRPRATVVITLNRCATNEVVSTVHGEPRRSAGGDDFAEVLVMVLYDGPSSNAFEFYALADYVDAPELATALRGLGLPTQHTPRLGYDLPADPDSPEPGVVVPFSVEVPGAFAIDGEVVRPLAFDTGGHATHYFHGPRGFVSSEHDTPIGGMSSVQGTLTVTGPRGAWLGDLLGTSGPLPVGGFYLEKTGGHSHAATLEE